MKKISIILTALIVSFSVRAQVKMTHLDTIPALLLYSKYNLIEKTTTTGTLIGYSIEKVEGLFSSSINYLNGNKQPLSPNVFVWLSYPLFKLFDHPNFYKP